MTTMPKTLPPWTGSALRRASVLFTLGLVTWNYYLFSHFVHKPRHFEPPHGKPNNGTGHGDNGHGDDHHEDHHHGKHGDFDSFHLKKDGLFLYGLALPILFLTLAALIWNPSTSTKGKPTPPTSSSLSSSSTTKKDHQDNSKGDPNVQKWTIVCFVVPLFLVMFDGARGHQIFHSNSQQAHAGWNLYVRICMSLMSPSGYAATWALSLFLIPVTKHSPLLDWLHVTPVQALAFHRVAGWTGFWNSCLHGFLHLRHLMDVLNPHRTRTRFQQLKFLLLPNTFGCFRTQNPLKVFWGRQDPYDGSEEDAEQCWLALVNLTGLISVIAFVALAITSLPQVRRYSYALFYRVHIPSAWIMLVTAIWHYPTCALVLIPNIVYYLSFNIPVWMIQNTDDWIQKWRQPHHTNASSSPLVEANLIRGGSIELVFASARDDFPRHESRFARLLCRDASPLSHPFSIFSRHDLVPTTSADGSFSMLLRPSGPFTENLTKKLFPDDCSSSSSNDETNPQEFTNDEQQQQQPLLAPPPFCDIRVDSYYAGSFDWVEHAMTSHDEILLVAGGVGIVPFLEFLPSLQQRIEMESTILENTTPEDSSPIDREALLESGALCGPSKIHLHWYCRELGLASYVWSNYLRHHVGEAWEGNRFCQNRLKIHLHLTSINPTTLSATSPGGGEDILRNSHNAGLRKKQTFFSTRDTISPVHDANFTQIWWVRLFSPGIIMATGTILHWWWYKQFIVDEKYRHDNLIIRTHSIVFSLFLALLVSVLVELFLRKHNNNDNNEQNTTTPQVQRIVLEGDSVAEMTSITTPTPIETNTDINPEDQTNPENHQSAFTTNANFDTSLLKVTGGRPTIDSVARDILRSDRPGVYSCGPRPLMETLESSIRNKRTDCAFYREDSEM